MKYLQFHWVSLHLYGNEFVFLFLSAEDTKEREIEKDGDRGKVGKLTDCQGYCDSCQCSWKAGALVISLQHIWIK